MRALRTATAASRPPVPVGLIRRCVVTGILPAPAGRAAASHQTNRCEGRSCIYVPITQNGKLVDSQGFMLDTEDE
jgi:hypothetical protein